MERAGDKLEEMSRSDEKGAHTLTEETKKDQTSYAEKKDATLAALLP